MKILITSYSFDASAKEVTILQFVSFSLEQVRLITNVTDGTIIFNFAKSSLGATLAGNVLTLEYDTTSMSDSDALAIDFEDSSSQPLTNDELRDSAIDVTVSNFPDSQVVTATDLDTRDLTFASDKVDVSGSFITIDTTGLSTEAKQDDEIALLTNIQTYTGNTSSSLVDAASGASPLYVNVLSSGDALTDTELRASDVKVTLDSEQVSISNFPATQAVSATNLDIRDLVFASDKVDVSGSSVTTGGLTDTQLRASDVKITLDGESVPVTGTISATQNGTWNISNVSGTVSLPTGASTAAKQPALGTAGTPSADVITVQGVTSMTALKVDGSAVTQPISATNLDVALSTRLKPADTLAAVTTLGTITNVVHVDDNSGVLTVDGNTFETSGSAAANNTDLISLNVLIYKSLSFQITGTFSASIAFQASNDNSNWTACTCIAVGNAANAPTASTSGTGIWSVCLSYKYFRVRTTAYTSGTANIVAILSALPYSPVAVGGQIAVAGTATHNVAVSGGPVRIGAYSSAAAPSDVSGDGITTNLWTLRNGALATQLTASGALIPGDATSGLVIQARPATTGGLTTYHLASAGSTNAVSVKGSAGQVYGWYIYNSNAAARKLCFHNTSGTPTAGASIFMSLVVAPNSAASVNSTIGIAFSSGIAITTVTGLADSDNTAVASNDLIINIYYS